MISPLQTELTYVKRHRMFLDLTAPLPAVPPLAERYRWVGWQPSLMEAHAQVKVQCFQGEIDSLVFENLRDYAGCMRLMNEISHRSGFRPEATWLIALDDEYVGTVQGVLHLGEAGAIQNLGIVPEHRGRGLGKALLLRALHAFRERGLARATLEVTAQNKAAVHIYRQIGFRYYKTIYKTIDPALLAKNQDGEDWYL